MLTEEHKQKIMNIMYPTVDDLPSNSTERALLAEPDMLIDAYFAYKSGEEDEDIIEEVYPYSSKGKEGTHPFYEFMDNEKALNTDLYKAALEHYIINVPYDLHDPIVFDNAHLWQSEDNNPKVKEVQDYIEVLVATP